MAYSIDFTSRQYAWRSRRKFCLRMLLIAAIAVAVWEVYDGFRIYNSPTLNMRLAEYEAVTRPIEEMDAAWSEAEKEYFVMDRYVRLVWVDNHPTNFLNAMALPDSRRPGKGFRPLRWVLNTGGECRLDGVYVFRPGDKAAQATNIAAEVSCTITSAVDVVGNKVDLQGIKKEHLVWVDELDISARFFLADSMKFPAKEKSLSDCVGEIKKLREKVQTAKISKDEGPAAPPNTAQSLMTKYVDLQLKVDKRKLPDYKVAINIPGWFDAVDKVLENDAMAAGKTLPDSDVKRRRGLRAVWDKVGDARLPWQRFRELDNSYLKSRTIALSEVSDGVKRFKTFLDKRREDCKRRLEPLIEAYDRKDVFNEPLVVADLHDRVAAAAGITRAKATFRELEPCEPSVLVKDGDRFEFTWVRWTLYLGARVERDVDKMRSDAGNPSQERLSLAKVADCARRALELGPGYALESAKIDFAPDGEVAGAVLEGLLPVKNVTPVQVDGDKNGVEDKE